MNVTLALSLLASSGAEIPLPTKVPGLARDTLIVLIAASAVGLVLLGVLTLWAKTRRHRRRHHHRHHHRSETKPAETPTAELGAAETAADPATETAAGPAADPDADPSTHRHRRRKRRRDHRPRNPTLAETGGLPPPRPEGQVPPGL